MVGAVAVLSSYDPSLSRSHCRNATFVEQLELNVTVSPVLGDAGVTE